MARSNWEEIFPGIVVASCPLPPGWDMEVAVVLARGARLGILDSGVREFMPMAIEPALTHLGCRVSDIALIANTHGHWDHVQGNAALHAASGAPIWIPAPDAGLLLEPPDRELGEGDMLDFGGTCFQVVMTPGHSEGMACFYDADRRLLVASDAIQGYGPGSAGLPLYFHSGRLYRASLRRLLGLPVDTLVVGHPFQWSGPPAYVHRGQAAHAFIEESLDIALRFESIVRGAVEDCASAGYECVRDAAARRLQNDPVYPFRGKPRLHRLAEGSLKSELYDLGLN